MATTIDRWELVELMRSDGAQLVEVLPADAFEALHLPDAVNIPLETLDEEAARTLDRARPVVVYCYDYQ